MPTFNSRLKELRTQKELSQQALADAIGISKSSISMYECGEREPSLEILEAFADYFNVDMNYLLGKSISPLTFTDEQLKNFNAEEYFSKKVIDISVQSWKQAMSDIEFSNSQLRSLNLTETDLAILERIRTLPDSSKDALLELVDNFSKLPPDRQQLAIDLLAVTLKGR
jgi:transcriptional regulator with XRE-family HTH domain